MLEVRSNEPEFLDQGGYDPRLAERSYRFMKYVNRYLGGVSMVRRFIAGYAQPGRPLRVLDMGSGICDIPLAVSAWAQRRGLDIHFTCLDLSPVALRLGRQEIQRATDGRVHLLQRDVFAYYNSEQFDLAVGSMFFHHLDDEQILRLLRHLRPMVTKALLINDVLRAPRTYLAAAAMSMFLNKSLRHDLLTSVRRGFRVDELRRLLGQLDGVSVEAGSYGLGRLRAIVKLGEDRFR